MNKEEMEKKRDLLALEKREPYELEYRNIVGALFCAGWDACANEYDEELRIAKADIMNLMEEVERLKSWEHFKKTLSVMQTFQSLGELEKEAINLMIDGIKYRNTKNRRRTMKFTANDPTQLLARISNDFNYHCPPPEKSEVFKAIRNQAKELANLIAMVVPPGREQSTALTRLEEAVMHAIAGIARQYPKE